jgi:chromosomal replication initiator protein
VDSRHAGSSISHAGQTSAIPSAGQSGAGGPGGSAAGRQPGRDAERSGPDRADDRRPGRRAFREAGSETDSLLAALEQRVDPVEVDRYFGVGGVRVERRDDRRVRVLGSSGFLTRLVEKRFGAVLHEAAESTFGSGVEVEYAVDPAADALKPADPADLVGRPGPAGPARPRTNAGASGEVETSLDQGMRLSDFCVGPTNRLAYAAALRLAEQPESFGGPLFLHGPCGVGKTHLLQGIVLRMLERGAERGAGGLGRPARVRYVNAEDFVGEFTQAIRKNATDKFRAKYRKLDLLCVDDVHLIAGKPATQQELVQTINATELSSGRLALASDAHPRQLGHMSDALVSRFMAGMVVKVDLPDAALTRQLVAKIAARRGVPIQPAAVERIVEYAARAGAGQARGMNGPVVGPTSPCCSVRELEGIVLKVEAVWRLLPELSGGPVGVLAVERALGENRADAPGSGPRRPPRGDEVVAAACRVLNVSASEFMGRGRHKRVVLARSIAATLCRRFTTMSYPEIARAMGRPNHSTIITACQRLARQLETGEPSGLDGDLAEMSIARLIELADDETRRIAAGDRSGGPVAGIGSGSGTVQGIR